MSAGIVPIENSIEGAVTATLDGLAFGRAGLRIIAEVLLPIHFDLFVPRVAARSRVREVLSHPHALAQCRKFIHTRKLATRSALSTAEACQTLRDRPMPGVGAIASGKAGANGAAPKPSALSASSRRSLEFRSPRDPGACKIQDLTLAT